MTRFNDPEMSPEDFVMALSDGIPGALVAMSELLSKFPEDAAMLFLGLDKLGIYGSDMWDFYNYECNHDVEEFRFKIMAKVIAQANEGGMIEIGEPDEADLSIQTRDDKYFEAHPGDDYYVRPAVAGELARAGYENYTGLILVYVIEEGVRLRRPVTSVEEAIQFMVDLEKSQDE